MTADAVQGPYTGPDDSKRQHPDQIPGVQDRGEYEKQTENPVHTRDVV